MSTKTEEKRMIEWARCNRKIRLKKYDDFNDFKIFSTIIIGVFLLLGFALLLQSHFQNVYAFVPSNAMRNVTAFPTLMALNATPLPALDLSNVTFSPMFYYNYTVMPHLNSSVQVQYNDLFIGEVATAPGAGYIIVRQSSLLAYAILSIVLTGVFAALYFLVINGIQGYIFEDVVKCVAKERRDE
jgi:hypothetical protein